MKDGVTELDFKVTQITLYNTDLWNILYKYTVSRL